MLGDQEVGGQTDRREPTGGHPGTAETSAVPDLDDEREPGEREDERRPDAAADRLVEDEPSPERDEDRRDELDQQGDPDVEPVNREEVGPLNRR